MHLFHNRPTAPPTNPHQSCPTRPHLCLLTSSPTAMPPYLPTTQLILFEVLNWNLNLMLSCPSLCIVIYLSVSLIPPQTIFFLIPTPSYSPLLLASSILSLFLILFFQSIIPHVSTLHTPPSCLLLLLPLLFLPASHPQVPTFFARITSSSLLFQLSPP